MDSQIRGREDPRLIAILVTYKRSTYLDTSLSRLCEQTVRPRKVIVIDNEPSEANAAVIETHRRQVLKLDYRAMPENVGPAGGIAAGMGAVLADYPDCSWIVLLDDDDPPQDQAIFESLLGFAEDMAAIDPQTGMVGLTGARFDLDRGLFLKVPMHELVGAIPVDYVPGNRFPFLRVSAVRRTGVFRSDFFFGLDDLEYGLRMRRAGFKLYAHGDLWKQSRLSWIGPRKKPKTSRFMLGEQDQAWRRYYSLRNLIFIMRDTGNVGAAFKITIIRGMLKPLANTILKPRRAYRSLRTNWKACNDAWRGRTGRVVDPN